MICFSKINQDDIPNYALEADLDCYFFAKPGSEVAPLVIQMVFLRLVE